MSRGGRIRRGSEPTKTTNLDGIFILNECADYIAEGKWPTIPDAIDDLNVAVGDTVLDLSWTAPSSNGLPFTLYSIEYTPNGGSSTVVTTSNTTYQLTGLVNDTEYSVRVGVVVGSRINYSNSETGTPTQGLPLQPAGADAGDITGDGTSESAYIWGPTLELGSANRFGVTASTLGPWFNVVESLIVSFTVNNKGAGAGANPVIAGINTDNNNSLSLLTTNSYNVGQSFDVTLPANTTFTIAGRQNDKGSWAEWWELRNGNGSSLWNISVYLRDLDTVTNLTSNSLTWFDGSAILTWTVPARHPQATSYQVSYSTSGGAETLVNIPVGSSYTLTGLTDGITYDVKVRMMINDIAKPYSNTIQITTQPAPAIQVYDMVNYPMSGSGTSSDPFIWTPYDSTPTLAYRNASGYNARPWFKVNENITVNFRIVSIGNGAGTWPLIASVNPSTGGLGMLTTSSPGQSVGTTWSVNISAGTVFTIVGRQNEKGSWEEWYGLRNGNNTYRIEVWY